MSEFKDQDPSEGKNNEAVEGKCNDPSDNEGKNDDGKATKTFSWMPAGCEPLADGEYDAIIMGTGLTECTISGLLSVNGKRVLHLDRNGYYGADTASLSLINLFQKFRDDAPNASLGHSRGMFYFVLYTSFFVIYFIFFNYIFHDSQTGMLT
jgi:hypothetical protein